MFQLLSFLLAFLITNAQTALADNINEVLPDKFRGGNLQNLPSGDATTQFMPAIIDILFKITSIVIFASLLYAGILYIIARHDEKDYGKAKNIMIYAVSGIGVMVTAYAIVKGVTTITFNR